MRAHIRYVLAFLMVGAATVGWGRASHTASANNQLSPFSRADAIEKVSTSVVCIQVSVSYNTSVPAHDKQPAAIVNMTGVSGGTGFIIDNQYDIATANHVINVELLQKNFESLEKQQGRILVPGSFRVGRIVARAMIPTVDGTNGPMIYAGATVFDATVVKQDNKRDIAILSAPMLGKVVLLHINGKDTRATVASLQIQKPRAGDAVSVSGFPAFYGIGQIPVLTTDSGTISTATWELSPNFFVFLANLHVNHGDSGGPVFKDNDGRVIGMVDAFLSASEGGNSDEAVIIPIKDIVQLASGPGRN